MTRILVTPLSALSPTLDRYRPSHVISLLSASHMIDTPPGIAAENHLRLCLSDIVAAQDGLTPPGDEHVARLIAFGRHWDARAPLVAHCWAGVSRSMAAAFIVLCARTEVGAESALAKKIRARAAHANPNRLMVGLADRLLGRDGRMMDAVESMGRAKFVEEGVPVEFPLEQMIR